MRRNPSWLLDVKAHVPCHRLSAAAIGENDLIFFTVLIGLTALSAADIHKALASSLPIYLVSPTPDQAWIFNPHRTDLGRIDVSCQDPQPFNLELVGCTEARHILSDTLSLQRGSATSSQKFRSLNYIHSDRFPSAPIVLKAGMLDQDWVITPRAWVNLWIYGMEVLFAGWLTKRTFLHRARRIPAGARMQLGMRLQSESYVLALHELRPVSELIERTRQG